MGKAEAVAEGLALAEAEGTTEADGVAVGCSEISRFRFAMCRF